MGEQSMVERVARAIYHGTARNKPYEQLSALRKQGCLMMARAAIEAMREPTDTMVVIGDADIIEALYDHSGVRRDPTPAQSAYRAMIDAALTDREG